MPPGITISVKIIATSGWAASCAIAAAPLSASMIS